MSKVPNNPHEQIRPGAVLGSESLPFESMIFSNDSTTPATDAPAASAGASRYLPQDKAARRVAETPRPAFSKLFRPPQ